MDPFVDDISTSALAIAHQENAVIQLAAAFLGDDSASETLT